MAEISFTSAIRPISLNSFGKTIVNIGSKNFVDYPWTIKDSVKAPMAYTRDIRDCSMLGITDGQNVLMMHLCPGIKSNRNPYNIKQFIAQNIDLKNPELQAILAGSKLTKKSQDIYNKLVHFLETYKIPYSELKVGKDSINIAYSSSKDEWVISSLHIDKLLQKGMASLQILKDTFNKIKISSIDEVL